MKKILTISLLFCLVLLFSKCKKKTDPHIPPGVSFKTGGNYISGNTSVAAGDSVLVGISVVKNEDNLKSFNISYAYDGASTTITLSNYLMTPAEYGGYATDVWIKTRHQAGSELWVFTILDRDGNLAQQKLTLTVH